MGRCSCIRLDDGEMYLLLLDRKMCRVQMCLVQLEDWKMFQFLLDNGKMLLILLEDVKVFPILLEEGTRHLFFLMKGCEGYLASAGGTEWCFCS
jgi:hypothetical protein